jgi:dTDP-4-amino-4,6-dideoxygalactose transaminase
VVEAKRESNFVNMIGFNYRMTEIEAAIARHQFKKLPTLVEERRRNVAYLEAELSKIPCLTMPKIRAQAEHVYYAHAIKFDEKISGVHRNKFVEAVKAELMPIELRETEGIKVGCGYVKPLYLLPMFQQQIAYGSSGFPWSSSGKKYDYSGGICPVVEHLYSDLLITHEYMRPGMTKKDLDDIVDAFVKVWENRSEI